jgi:CRISPR-associated endonuclease/helicase Cas3
MSQLDASRFTEFYQALHGPDREPFPWQTRLARRVCEGKWPRVIALPTAAGKTTCIEIALFALACQAEWKERTAPRRVFFVVDRRVIVDQAFEHTKAIAERLHHSDSVILREVASRLRTLANSDRPVEYFQLRGGIYREDSWARTPLQPTVIASTVDQVGSRLLYRGYGLRSGSARPIHAGLAANDSLILLDEAHCARPFGQTAEAVSGYRSWAKVPLGAPFQVVQMTATPQEGIPDEEIVRDDEDDRNHPVLGKRIAARKPARLVVADKAKGRGWQSHLAVKLSEEAEGLMNDAVRAVGVIVNRVDTARRVCDLLSKKYKSRADVVLLIGRMRPIDRDEIVSQMLSKLKPGTKEPLGRPVFVVATQCLEVGADLDFHALVTECASLDALRQRFGRLNRVAARENAPACIVIRADQTEIPSDEDEDPIYGKSLAQTWQWLQANATDTTVDMGAAAIAEKWNATPPEKRLLLNAPAPDAPVLLPAHLDCWVQTSPVPCPDPDPAVFLHGPRRAVPDVQVVWRADLPEDRKDEWADIVSLCPPSSSEAMPVPLPAFRAWLAGRDESTDGSDVEGESVEMDEEPAPGKRAALRWAGPDDPDTMPVEMPGDVRPGDVLVLPTTAGGWDVLGHIPKGTTESESNGIDLGDQAFQKSRDRAMLRITPGVVAQWPRVLQIDAAKQFWTDPDLQDEEDRQNEELDGLFSIIAQSPSASDWMREAAANLNKPRQRMIEIHPAGGLVVKGRRRLRRHLPADTFTDEDDSASGLEIAGRSRPVTLANHCAGVEKFARQFAAASGLPGNLQEVIGWAGRCHDLGKADRRFQALLRNLPRRAVGTSLPLLAKSEKVPRSVRARQQARKQSGYPAGARHELLSVRLAESHLKHLPPELDRELMLHLIGSHHGRARPFAPLVDEPEGEPVAEFEHHGEKYAAKSTVTDLERLDSGVAERFWTLVRRYGWWGLAYLEAILRLADHRQSEQEQREQEESHGTHD